MVRRAYTYSALSRQCTEVPQITAAFRSAFASWLPTVQPRGIFPSADPLGNDEIPLLGFDQKLVIVGRGIPLLGSLQNQEVTADN